YAVGSSAFASADITVSPLYNTEIAAIAAAPALNQALTAAATTVKPTAMVAVQPQLLANVLGSTGAIQLGDTGQSIGGAEGTFGSSSSSSSSSSAGGSFGSSGSASSSGQGDKSADEKSPVGRKEDDKKKDEEAAPRKQAEKPAPKKLATCS
ncbi:MAG: hypothetical protein NT123_20335, partial [Proteobacteria bacterium]|nr:hypothetical protein [Pseudomonadota bacterium]